MRSVPDNLEEYRDRSIILAFVSWPVQLGLLPDCLKYVYANQLYFDKKGGYECIVCGSSDTVWTEADWVPFLKERMFAGKEPKTGLVRCEKCDLIFSSYRPNDVEMDRHYRGYGGEDYMSLRKKVEPGFREEMLCGGAEFGNKDLRKANIVDFISGIVDPKSIKSVLDYGGNRGEVIPKDYFTEAECFVYDIGVNETLPGIHSLKKRDDLTSRKWDFIMNCHTLEHVSYPMKIVETIAGVMEDNSYFYLEVPGEAMGKNIHEHINGEFTLRTLRAIADRAGLRIVKEGQIPGNCVRALYCK